VKSQEKPGKARKSREKPSSWRFLTLLNGKNLKKGNARDC
jgi:hypothetical protein